MYLFPDSTYSIYNNYYGFAVNFIINPLTSMGRFRPRIVRLRSALISSYHGRFSTGLHAADDLFRSIFCRALTNFIHLLYL